MVDSFGVVSTLDIGDKEYQIVDLAKFSLQHDISRLPFSLKILLENVLRHEDNNTFTKEQILAIASRATQQSVNNTEIAFVPSRVLLQDFTGVPAIVDLAAMRDAMQKLGGKVNKINPLQPAELVIDHSIQVDSYGKKEAQGINAKLEFHRNKERYQFLRWGQNSFNNFKVVPPDTGIVHQVNLEYLARVVFSVQKDNSNWLYPDTLVGTDSHTTMINGLGVLGWGVGGIEAEAAMLGQPVTMLIPEVVGFKITGSHLPEGVTATDLVLRIVELLRQKGVVGKFVEFYGDGLAALSLADRATIANMSPEFGATCGFFPVDNETLHYMKLSGRSAETINIVEEYSKKQGLFREPGQPELNYNDVLELDLNTVDSAIAGPKRPQDRIPLKNSKAAFFTSLGKKKVKTAAKSDLTDGSIVIAAITSCTNTSNPSVMVAAGLLAKKAVELGLRVPKWVKTSLAPGSKVVTDYLEKAKLMPYLRELGFYIVGYGCTTCIGNSGPLDEEVSNTIHEYDLSACAVLSGNRNFEGRIHPDVKMNYLASPPLVVAFALLGTMAKDLVNDSLGESKNGPVYLKDIWPTEKEINEVIAKNVQTKMFTSSYAEVFKGSEQWQGLPVPKGELYEWNEQSTYVKNPPYFTSMQRDLEPVKDILQARVLVKLGDSVTTDHISPAGSIKADSPAGLYLQEQGVEPIEFNSYGSRRGNHEVMMRGTFANIRLKNQLAPGTEGSWTTLFPEKKQLSIFEAAKAYQADKTPCIVLAGKEYGTGSSRDWAAKGPCLLGVKAVIAENFERIHRSNLVGMGILPLIYKEGENAESLGLTGEETYSIAGLDNAESTEVKVKVVSDSGEEKTFLATVRLLTPQEREYYRHGGILQYVLRKLL